MKAIENFIDAVMGSFPRTEETQELRRSLLEHTQDKYEALLAEGMGEYEALGRVVEEFGSVEELRAGLGLPEGAGYAAGDSDPELSDLLLEYHLFCPKRRVALAVSAVLLILSPFSAPLLSVSDRLFPLTPVLFALLIGLGIGLQIYFRGRTRDYRERIRDRRAQLGLPQTPPEGGAPFPGEGKSGQALRRQFSRTLNATLPIWVVLIYLYIGIFWNLWHPGWLIFFAIPLYYTTLSGRGR
ncbi:MAG: hypothetical protein HFG27_07135 [Provencibacterium sp.]|jgi:hypothetical protein|nr:hypothetical protein [Provencibacterium sp.]